MAGFLEVEWTELMKEITPMADKKMMQMEEIIESSTRKEAGRNKKTVSLEGGKPTSGVVCLDGKTNLWVVCLEGKPTSGVVCWKTDLWGS